MMDLLELLKIASNFGFPAVIICIQFFLHFKQSQRHELERERWAGVTERQMNEVMKITSESFNGF